MIRKILDWIIQALLRLYHSPVARDMAMSALETAAGEFKEAAQLSMVAVKYANDHKEWTSQEKRNYVLGVMKEEFGNIPESVARQLIENAVGLIKAG